MRHPTPFNSDSKMHRTFFGTLLGNRLAPSLERLRTVAMATMFVSIASQVLSQELVLPTLELPATVRIDSISAPPSESSQPTVDHVYSEEILNCAICRQRLGLPALAPGERVIVAAKTSNPKTTASVVPHSTSSNVSAPSSAVKLPLHVVGSSDISIPVIGQQSIEASKAAASQNATISSPSIAPDLKGIELLFNETVSSSAADVTTTATASTVDAPAVVAESEVKEISTVVQPDANGLPPSPAPHVAEPNDAPPAANADSTAKKCCDECQCEEGKCEEGKCCDEEADEHAADGQDSAEHPHGKASEASMAEIRELLQMHTVQLAEVLEILRNRDQIGHNELRNQKEILEGQLRRIEDQKRDILAEREKVQAQRQQVEAQRHMLEERMHQMKKEMEARQKEMVERAREFELRSREMDRARRDAERAQQAERPRKEEPAKKPEQPRKNRKPKKDSGQDGVI